MTTNTLIIWLWEESIDEKEQVWRGSVSHVQSGRLAHFQTLADLYRQIALLVASDTDPPDDDTGHLPMKHSVQ